MVHEALARLVRRLRREGGSAVHHTLPTVLQSNTESFSRVRNVPSGQNIPPFTNTAPASVPLSPRPAQITRNPIVTASDIDDFPGTDFVADPFLFIEDPDQWHLFVEVFSQFRDPTAAIAHVVSHDGGSSWEYDRVVLETGTHLAFPYVFKWRGSYYMLPSAWAKAETPAPITLYRSDSLPGGWTPVAELVAPDIPLYDCVLFRWNEMWWAICGTGEDLYAFSAQELEADQWRSHPGNPVVSNRPEAGRPGGRPIVREDDVVIFYQNCAGAYGESVNAYRITELSETTFSDRPASRAPVLAESNCLFGWNAGRMHHIDPWFVDDQWYCAVDGSVGQPRIFGEQWSIGLFSQDCG